MGNEILKQHQFKIFRGYHRCISNLIKLDRFTEAEQASVRFTAILRLWAIQAEKMRGEAERGMMVINSPMQFIGPTPQGAIKRLWGLVRQEK
jgi:hypothetical protein